MHKETVRSDFEKTTRRLLREPLAGTYSIEVVEEHTWWTQWRRVRSELSSRELIDFAKVYSEAERDRINALDELLPRAGLAHWLLFKENDVTVGCYAGHQEAFGRYYMMQTAVLPEHQGRGLYTEFLPRLLEVLRQTGFREAWSRHNADNNQVLIPKLRHGFFVSGFEVSARFGLLVHLRCPLIDNARKVYEYRIDAGREPTLLAERGLLKER